MTDSSSSLSLSVFSLTITKKERKTINDNQQKLRGYQHSYFVMCLPWDCILEVENNLDLQPYLIIWQPALHQFVQLEIRSK
jgi:hypothetical protein